MANNPKKIVGSDGSGTIGDPGSAQNSGRRGASRITGLESLADSLGTAPSAGATRRRRRPPPPLLDADEIGARGSDPRAFRAANDDQQSIGQVLQALQQRPPRTSYFVASIFSCAWVVGCLALSWAYLG